MIKRVILATASLAALALVSACGGPENDFEKAINTAFAEKKECYSLTRQREAKDFPLRIERGIMSRDEINPILTGLQKAGMIDVKTSKERYKTTDHISITDKGLKNDVWHPKEGFCIGSPEVEEIVRFTYDQNGQNKERARVELTWRLGNLPKWLDRDDFADVDGMTTAQEGGAVVQKSSDGWHAMTSTGTFF